MSGRQAAAIAFARKGRSDLRRHRVQAIVLLLVLSTASAALVLAVTLQSEASRPWDRQFARAHGAHVWAVVRAPGEVRAVTDHPEVTEVAGPYTVAYPTLVFGHQRVAALARAMTGDNHPSVGQLTLSSGRWLGPAGDIVLEHSVAQHFGLKPGMTVTLRGDDGAPHSLVISGVVVTTDTGPFVSSLAGVYVRPATLGLLASPTNRAVEVGVRIADPGATRAFIGGVIAAVPATDLFGAWDWAANRRDIRAQAGQVTSVLTLFGIFLLGAATLVLLNAIASRVVAQSRDVGLLKAIGWTPRQVFELFLAEHLLLAVGGLAVGTAIAAAIGPPLAAGAVHSVGLRAGGISRHGLVTVWLVVFGVVSAATAIPAWRASRISAVNAITSGITPRTRRRSALGRAARRVGLGPPVVVGCKNSFARPLRAWLTVGGLAVTVITVTFALVGWSTIDAFDHHPERLGARHQLDVYTGTPNRTSALLAGVPGIQTAYATTFVPGRVTGRPIPITIRAIGTLAHPYPLDVRAGRSMRAGGEGLVASDHLLASLGLHLGETAHVDVLGRTLPIHIVGRYLESPNGDLLTIGEDTLRSVLPEIGVSELSVVVNKGVSPVKVRVAILKASNDQLTVQLVKASETSLTGVRVAIAGMSAILLLIGLGNLLVTVLLGVSDRTRETGLLKSVGFTPRQVRTAVVVGAAALGVTAIAFGIPIGLVLARVIGDHETSAQGLGAGVIQLPSALTITTFAVGGVLASALSAAVPAGVAARIPAARALRAE